MIQYVYEGDYAIGYMDGAHFVRFPTPIPANILS